MLMLKKAVSVLELLLHQVVEVRANRGQRFRQSRLFVAGVDREVECRDCSVREPVGQLRAEQAGIGWDVDPEALLAGATANHVRELRTQQRIAPEVESSSSRHDFPRR